MLWLKRSKAACPHILMLGADAERDYSTKLLVMIKPLEVLKSSDVHA